MGIQARVNGWKDAWGNAAARTQGLKPQPHSVSENRLRLGLSFVWYFAGMLVTSLNVIHSLDWHSTSFALLVSGKHSG